MQNTFEYKRCSEILKMAGIEEAILFAKRNIGIFRLAAHMRKRTHGRADPVRARYLQSAAIYRQILRRKLLTEREQSIRDSEPNHRSIFGDLMP